MHHFHYKDGEMFCEEVPLKKIAAEVGTPFYVYSAATLKRHFEVFDASFEEVPHIICFAVKANSNLAVLNLLGKLSCGADIVSGGELYRALKAGIDPKKIVYAGVGKTEEEIEFALKSDILMFNIESFQELEKINEVAGRLKKKARIALRVNPNVDPKTHPYISTGLKKNKFGIPIENAYQEYEYAASLDNIEVVGAHCHIGSQLTEISPFVDATKIMVDMIKTLKSKGINIKYLDLGGGLGIKYNEEMPPSPKEYADKIIDVIRGLDVTLVFEPGRVIAGNAGVLVTRVLYTKETELKHFKIVDAAMNDLMRPILYGSFHDIKPVKEGHYKTVYGDIVGPICETGDFLAKDRNLPDFQQGDLIAVMSAGAYGFTMSSNYNSRPRVPEILVNKDKYYIVRRRETYDDLIGPESIPEDL
ncbi:diaminopimelate decarboxylase [Deferribacter desulfuricans SSM1]|uniref:Diaminopimelate decarboxylase n=1 Tax=Deferribacter desulfuricans (strain DSM 14783 / JCM 11476 / NBRC 101012 / SSM1) TaxID=639282 RepID=D3PAV1_DEFDS|nr:diaminopimelate decarboxylase [Deferribacter desulfuricans]BAI79724.1 diaminopimelate decarboxylase [Deferribacter desulfuricans SSM1]